MEVREAMHKPAAWVEADTPVSEVARQMRADDIGALPVGRDDRLIGMITDRDLVLRVLAEGRDPKTTKASDVMTEGVVWCRTSQPISDAIHQMEERRIRRLPVIDDNKRLVGMLALGDIAHSATRDLTAEVVHAVADHHA
ncbi:CBS domain-containing protein [Cereibacter sediminicola]|uniref:CBS domain-containing protein n=1 Tax=Cereibacter sediminicola TaxID=2584941 RepID=UPI00119FA669|nr:CBS domain-containing protein [Cereibacter sediminicola]